MFVYGVHKCLQVALDWTAWGSQQLLRLGKQLQMSKAGKAHNRVYRETVNKHKGGKLGSQEKRMRIGEKGSPLYSWIQMTPQNSWKSLTVWKGFIWRPHWERDLMSSEKKSRFGIPMWMNRTGGDLKCQGHEKKKKKKMCVTQVRGTKRQEKWSDKGKLVCEEGLF